MTAAPIFTVYEYDDKNKIVNKTDCAIARDAIAAMNKAISSGASRAEAFNHQYGVVQFTKRPYNIT